jgi:hypothetical protein
MKKSKGKLYMLRRLLNKIVLTLCLLTIVPFSATSQDTSRITITSDQLRTANLIFAEHKEYSRIVPLLRQENINLNLINKSWERTDSLRTVQLYNQDQIIQQQNEQMDKLEKSLRVSQTVGGTFIGIGIITVVVCLLLK